MTKQRALQIFLTYPRDSARGDTAGRCEEWSIYMDFLFKSGNICPKKYYRWTNPFRTYK